MKECPACRRCFPDHVNHCPNDGDATTPSLIGEPLLDGRYQLERRLGQGGMGVVFQARHIFLKTSHAIKIILPDLVGNDPMLVTRFRQEAMAAAAIHHQNIIAVTDFGVVRGTMPFLVMEFVKGRSLHDLLAEEKRLSPARALEIMSPICAGMSAAHRQNIVHRDLKPLNIMMQEGMPINEGLKILDFGLAKIKSGELLGSFVQAKTSGLMGSPFYMAPEQWSDEEPDSRADIYSLGVILYQMLGGDVPFKGASIPSIMKKHLTEPPPPFNSLGADVPPVVEAVVHHALEKEAGKRPATVVTFIEELRVAVSSLSGSAVGPEVLSRNTSDLQTMISVPHISIPPQPSEAGTLVRVYTDPPQSRVFINNISVGTSDQSGELAVPDLPVGLHRVRVVHEGYADWEQQIDCSGGECRVNAQLHSLMARSQPHFTAEPATGNLKSSAIDASVQSQRNDDDETVVRRGDLAEQAGQSRTGFATTPIGAVKSQTRPSDNGQPDNGQPPASAASSPSSTQSQLRAGATQMLDERELAQEQAAASASSGRAAHTAQGRAHAAANDPAALPLEERKKSSMPLVVISLVALLVLGGAGAGAYFLFMRKPQTPPVVNGGADRPGGNTGNVNNGSAAQQTVKAEMVAIPGGTFQMGRNDGPLQEKPAHSITVGPFLMDKTEVTNAAYGEFVRETHHAPPEDWGGDKPPAGQEQMPVANVSFEDARSFAAWRSQRDGVTYRLPTEEEWEYAARNGEQATLYPWGNTWVADRAGIKDAGILSPRPVNSYPEGGNRWGVQDLIGNVWEWTSSRASVYPGNPVPSLPAEQKNWVVIRGGSYLSESRGERAITSTFRDWVDVSRKHQTLGFRLVRAGS